MTNPVLTMVSADIWEDDVETDKANIRQWGLEVETALNALISHPFIINGALSVTVNLNVLTVAVKTVAGADPSTTDPVYLVFRHATLTSGSVSVVRVTAALSLDISGGSTMGVTSGEAFELILSAFNDGGTARLSLYNPNASSVHYPIDTDGVSDSTAEGGAGAADSAGVHYTGTAVSAKAFRILARLNWASGLATAGLWSALPTYVRIVGDDALAVNVSVPGRQLIQSNRYPDLYKVLDADATGSNVNTAQPWFPTAGAVAVSTGWHYFEGVLRLSRAAGTTSHTTGILFAIGGGGAITNIDYLGAAKEGDANDLQDQSIFWANAATSLVLKAASTSATEQSMFHVRGWVLIGTAGTLTPQFIYSAAPGGAPTILRGSFFRLVPFGALNTQGTWS